MRARDGAEIELRAARPSDRDQLAALFARMSPVSIHHRYFGAVTRPELGWLDPLRDGEIAIVAVEAGRIVGLARAIPISRDRAEIAFEIGDSDQHRGLGTLLFHELERLAKPRGITAFIAEIEPDNHAMLDVLEHAGCAMRTTANRDGIHAELAL